MTKCGFLGIVKSRCAANGNCELTARSRAVNRSAKGSAHTDSIHGETP
jgi:hypothetical protein